METTVKATVAARMALGCRETYVQYEKMLELPGAAPLPAAVQAVTASPRVLSAVAEAGRVCITAGIDFRLSYESRAQGSLYGHTEAVLFEKTVDFAGVEAGDLCRTWMDVEETAFEPVKDEMGEIRKVRVKAFLHLLTEVERVQETELLTLPEDLEIQWTEVSQLRVMPGGEKAFVVPGRLSVSRGLPEAERVVGASGVLRELNWTVGEGAWRLSGVLLATVVYEGTVNGEQEVFALEESFPFREEFSLPGLLPDDLGAPEVTLERVRAEILHDGAERAAILECFADVRASFFACRGEKVLLAADAYSTREKLAVETAPVSLSALGESRRETLSLRESVQLPAEQLLEGLWVTDSRVLPLLKDGLTTGAQVSLWVEYLAREDGLHGIHGRRLRFDVPFDAPVSGHCRLLLRDVDVRPVGRGEMQLKAEVALFAPGEKTLSCRLPRKLRSEGELPETPALIFYRPGVGEDAFAAAKTLQVPLRTLLDAAGLGGDGKLPQKPLVLCLRRG